MSPETVTAERSASRASRGMVTTTSQSPEMEAPSLVLVEKRRVSPSTSARTTASSGWRR